LYLIINRPADGADIILLIGSHIAFGIVSIVVFCLVIYIVRIGIGCKAYLVFDVIQLVVNQLAIGICITDNSIDPLLLQQQNNHHSSLMKRCSIAV
jgi:hypothetical protein